MKFLFIALFQSVAQFDRRGQRLHTGCTGHGREQQSESRPRWGAFWFRFVSSFQKIYCFSKLLNFSALGVLCRLCTSKMPRSHNFSGQRNVVDMWTFEHFPDGPGYLPHLSSLQQFQLGKLLVLVSTFQTNLLAWGTDLKFQAQIPKSGCSSQHPLGYSLLWKHAAFTRAISYTILISCGSVLYRCLLLVGI